jgi:hypothetical protein
MLRLVAPLLLLCLTVACQPKAPTLPGLDTIAFRADRRGCAGYRARHLETLEKIRPLLLGLSEPQIDAAFGHPDANELGDRAQRVYIYLLAPGPACGGDVFNAPPTLRIRLNAVDKVSEATIAR